MNTSIVHREATKADLAAVLQLYAQPEVDDGKVLSSSEAERIYERMARYPDYKVYVAASQERDNADPLVPTKTLPPS